MFSIVEDELLQEFVAESRDHLCAIEPDLLDMEKDGTSISAETINRVFRAMHSIKGLAGFFGLDSIKQLSHVMESVLMLVRDGKVVITPELMDPLFSGVDLLKVMVEDVHGSNEVDLAPYIHPLTRILDGAHSEGPVKVEGVTTKQLFEISSDALRSAERQGLKLFQVMAYLHGDIQVHWTSPLAFLNKVFALGECLETRLDVSEIADLEDCLDHDVAISLLLATSESAESISQNLHVSINGIQELHQQQASPTPPQALPELASRPSNEPETGPIRLTSPKTAPEQADEAVVVPQADATSSGSSQPRHAKDASTETLRIRVDLLTKLMNLAGELVLGRNQLMRALADEARESGLGSILQNINQVTTSLQEGIMQTRMQPADSIFNRFPRIIRDMAKQLGKQIDLEIQGSEVELDKSLVELLTDPLTHIIRNSADHAIEMPDERTAAGKAAAGRIVLRAYHQDGHVNISIQDDGKGIDAARVGKKAVERGLITTAQCEQMSERDLVNLIFAPGFSTSDTVSELSGRGVGMDVVRSNTEKMGGTVEVSTFLGKGTTILLRLPLTLAIIPSMIVGVADQRFAIPQVHVVEFVSVSASELSSRIERVKDAEVLRLRDRLLPLMQLKKVLNISSVRSSAKNGGVAVDPSTLEQLAPETTPSDYQIVVLQVGSNQFGVVVDELFDIEEIVVKPPSVFAQNIKCFSGATIVGDGHVIMILDVGGLVTHAGLRFADLQAENKRRSELESQRAAVAASRLRPIILCTGAPDEYFAIPQDDILRLEMFSKSSIHHVGDQEFVTYRGKGLPLIRLESQLNVKPIDPLLKDIFVVIPKILCDRKVSPARAGIVISNIIDALEVDVKLEPLNVGGPAVLGSAVLQNNLTIFLKPSQFLTGTHPYQEFSL